MNYYLLTRDRASGSLDVQEFVEQETALAALRIRESESGARAEVVLFLAPDIATLRKTHPRFFPGALQELLRPAP